MAVDLEAVKCVDLGHHWETVFLGRAGSGPLKGLPVRLVSCATCHSQRLDHLTVLGKVTSRKYDLEPSYIEPARELDEDMHERRTAFRKEMIKQARNAMLWEDYVAERDAEVRERMSA